MKNKMTAILVIFLFIILDVFGFFFGNMLLNNNFVVTEGEYTYNDLFYSADNNKDYYRFKKCIMKVMSVIFLTMIFSEM